MTDKTIESILRRLNHGLPSDVIIRPIGTNVWWGFVWGLTPEGFMPRGVQETGEEFFFVKASDGQFVAAVLRMAAHDFHWYVLPEYRGNGILVHPLRTVILPFIFAQYDCSVQKGTLDPERPSAAYSQRLAQRVGFRKAGGSEEGDVYAIHREDVAEYVDRPSGPGDLPELEKLKTELKTIIDRSGWSLIGSV